MFRKKERRRALIMKIRPNMKLYDLDGGTQHLTSWLQVANRALTRTWWPSAMSTLAQVDRLKAHHRRAVAVTVQVRTRIRYGLVIPHLIQKGAG